MKRIDLPVPLLFAWMVLTLVLMGQGLRLAADRQEGVEPRRPPTLAPGEDIEVPRSVREIVYVGDARPRLALYEELPGRNLLRWVGEGSPADGVLLIPLEGLGPGQYALGAPPAAAGAAGQEMDRPEESLEVRARFRVLPD